MDGPLSNSPRLTSFAARARARLRLPSVVGDGASTLVSKVVSQVVQLVVFITAARVLDSAGFGFYAYSSAIAILLVVVAEGGWGEFVMKRHCSDTELDQIGTISILSGMAVTLAGFAIALAIWLGLHEPEHALLIALFSCWFLPSSLSVVFDGILVARGLLRKQSAIRIAAEVSGLCLSVAGLWVGWGVFSLVAGRLLTQLITLIASALVIRWWPKLFVSWSFAREVFEFSRHILSNRFIFFLRSYSGTLALGSFLGLAEAGYFRVAERIIAAVSELLGEPARLLAWTIFRRAAHGADSERPLEAVGGAATTFMTLFLAISIPIYLGMALISGEIIDLVLGQQWEPAAAIVSILCLKQVLMIPGYISEPLLSLTGAIRRMPRAMLIIGSISVGLVLVTAPFGVQTAAWGQVLGAFGSFFVSWRLQGRYGGLNWGRVIRNCAWIAAAIAVMAAAVYALGMAAERFSVGLVPTVALQVAGGGMIYLLTLAILHRVNGDLIPLSASRRA
jgi:O-antigen/teichoic acid export membrane protein